MKEIIIDGNKVAVKRVKFIKEIEDFGCSVSFEVPVLQIRIKKSSQGFTDLLKAIYSKNEYTIEFTEKHKYYLTIFELDKIRKSLKRETKTLGIRFVGTMNE